MAITLQLYQNQQTVMLALIQGFWQEHNGAAISPDDAAEDLAAWTTPNHRLYLIEKGNEPVGFVHLGSRGAGIDWLEDIYVRREHQGQGIGTRAIQLAEAIVQEYSESLYIEAAARNERAIRLYRRLGYDCLNTISLRKDFQPEKYESVHTEALYGQPLEIRRRK